ncbi:MAG: DUF3021 family protein [Oscillospiraceae bacterium]|nr:DUF3021 family protein [Oscillospiraceae bacterium]
MEEKKALRKEIVQSILMSFLGTIAGVSIVGWFYGDTIAAEHGGLLRLGREGLAYESIAQLFLFSVIIGTLTAIFMTDYLFKKIMLLWRCVITVILGVTALIVFVIVFRWFPLDEITGWVVMLTSFVGIFGATTAIAVIVTKREDKKLERQLLDYKLRNKDKMDLD